MNYRNKKIVQEKMIEVSAGKASPAPPIGPALGGLVKNVGAVCKDMNDRTRHLSGALVRILVRAFSDKSYELEIKQSPTSWLIKKELGIEKGSKTAGRSVAVSVTPNIVNKIAKLKFGEMTASSIEAAEKTVIGCFRSMGISLENGGKDA